MQVSITGRRAEAALILARAVTAAGPAILEVYAAGPAQATAKGDGSPVTEADLRAQAKIFAVLAREMSGIHVVSEEDEGERAPFDPDQPFLLVDPLDGTREFIAHNGEFTVNVALIENRVPVAGAVFAPAIGKLWVGGDGAWMAEGVAGDAPPPRESWRPIQTRAAPPQLVALASRSHGDAKTEAFLAGLPIGERRSAGSSLKFCLVAEGLADVYPRFGPTMEWDTAAGHAVLSAAGGAVLAEDGAPHRYGKLETGLLNGSFVAWGDGKMARR